MSLFSLIIFNSLTFSLQNATGKPSRFGFATLAILRRLGLKSQLLFKIFAIYLFLVVKTKKSLLNNEKNYLCHDTQNCIKSYEKYSVY